MRYKRRRPKGAHPAGEPQVLSHPERALAPPPPPCKRRKVSNAKGEDRKRTPTGGHPSTGDVINAFWQKSDLTLVVPDADSANGIRFQRQSAEHSCFIKRADISEPIEFLRLLNHHHAVRKAVWEGDWLRIVWQNRDALKYYCKRLHADTRDGEPKEPIPTYEGMVSPVLRHMVDNDLKPATPRQVWLDLETDSDVPFSQAIEGEARILSWATQDAHGNQAHAMLDEDTDEDEARLLLELWDVLDQYDQVMAWGGNRFDFPIIKARSMLHKLLRGAEREWRRWLWLDHLDLYRRMSIASAESGDEKQSMALNAVAVSLEVGEKDRFDASKTRQAWENATPCASAECMMCRSCLMKYNIQDTALMPLIEAKTGFIMLLQTVTDTCGTFADSRGSKPGVQVEGFLARLAHKQGHKFPTVLTVNVGAKYKGAYVHHPEEKAGIHRNVHVADFAAMYPSIIETWNMCPSTIIEGEIDPDSDDAFAYSPLTGFGFRTERLGILPLAVTQLLQLRKKWNDAKSAATPGTPAWVEADRRSSAYKITANSFYGVIGDATSRHYDRRVAESVTQCGKWLILETLKAAELRGMKVIYADSVTGDRPTIVREPGGDTEVLTFEELWECGIDVAGDGHRQYRTLYGWRALAVRDGVSGFYPIHVMMRHETTKEVVEISTKHGQTCVTVDHSLMSGGEQVKPDEFISQRLTFDRAKAQSSQGRTDLDLLEVLKDYELTRAYKGGLITRSFRSTADGKWIYFGGWGTPKQFIRRRYRTGTADYRALCRLLGGYLPDGSASIKGVTTSRHMFSISKSNVAWLRGFKKDAIRITRGVTFSVFDTGSNCHALRSGTALMANVFAVLGGVTSRRKCIPSFMFDACSAEVDVFLQAMMEGDGYCDASGAWSYTTNSPKLAAGLSYLWDQRGVAHSFSFRESKRAYSLRTRKQGERPSRYSIKHTRRPADAAVYDLTVEGAATFVDGVGRVVLHNTDSLFVEGATRGEFDAFCGWCNDELYPRILDEQGCTTNSIKLAYEKQFDRLIITTAKKYVGSFVHYKGTDATADSKPEIKGLEFKRGDSLRITRRFQEEIVYRLVGYQSTADPDDPVGFEEVCARWLDKVMEDTFDVDDILVSKTLNKPLDEYLVANPMVRIAQEMAARGEDVAEGARIKYVIVDASASPQVVQRVEEYDPDSDAIDRLALWDRQIWPATERLLETAFPGHSWERFTGLVKARKAAARAVIRAEKQAVKQAEQAARKVEKARLRAIPAQTKPRRQAPI